MNNKKTNIEILVDGNLIIDPQIIANEFNDIFINEVNHILVQCI